MKHHLIPIVLLCAVIGAVPSAPAAVPLRWTVETSRLQPAVFDVVRGETLNLEAAFQSYGKPLSMAAKPCAIFYQTNGMGSAWWTAPATATSNQVSVTFTPEMDPGATVINGFLGSTGDIYRAAFTLRYRHGPGAAPNALEPPAKITAINWSTVYNSNVESAPFVVKGGSGGLTPQDAGNIATNSIDAKVAAWALKPNPAPVADLTPATNYTDAASNNLATAIAEKRGLGDFVVYTNGFTQWEWYPTSEGIDAGLVAKLNEECRAIGSPQWDGFEWRSLYLEFTYNGVVYHWADDGLTPLDKNCTTFNYYPNLLSNNVLVCGFNASRERVNFPTESIIVTADTNTTGLAKFGADGVLTAAAAAEIRNAADVYSKAEVGTEIESSAHTNGGAMVWADRKFMPKNYSGTMDVSYGSLNLFASGGLLLGSAGDVSIVGDGSMSIGSARTGVINFSDIAIFGIGNTYQKRKVVIDSGSGRMCTIRNGGSITNSFYFPTKNGTVALAGDWTNSVGWTSFAKAGAGMKAITITNETGMADLPIELPSVESTTNIAEAVFAANADYALSPLTGTTVNIASGEIGNLSLTSAQTTLTVNLDFSAAADRSGDCMLYLINEADTEMTVGPSSVITIGWDGADIKAGTNVVMFTRMKREGYNSLVMVSTKEIK